MPHQRHATWPGTAALTCAGAGAAAPLSGSRQSRRNPLLSCGGRRAGVRGTTGEAAPKRCWHLPPPRQCRRRPEAYARLPGAMVSESPSRGHAECQGWLLTAHGGSAGLCRVPHCPCSRAGDAQRHPGTHHAAWSEAAPVLRGCGQGPGVASPRPRGPAEPCGTLEAGESGCPSPAPSAHVALDGGGHRGRCLQCCQGKCSLHRGLQQVGSGRIRQDLAGSGRQAARPGAPRTHGGKLCRRRAAAPRGSSHRQSSRSL